MENWRQTLDRWVAAGLLDGATAGRIEGWEAQQQTRGGLEWPVLIALIFGGIALGAGILLLVAARWESFSPAAQFALVIGMVVILHVGGIIAADTPWFRSAFHVLGNIAFGAAIFLTGQIFHLSAEVAHGFSLWTAGTVASWWLLRDLPQTILLAILVPVSIGAEYAHYHPGDPGNVEWEALWATLAALTYLSALSPSKESDNRRALMWVGAIGLLPAAFLLGGLGGSSARPSWWSAIASALVALLAAWLLRKELAWVNGLFILWALVVSFAHRGSSHVVSYATYPLFAIGSAGMVWWGSRETRPERINFGITGFALTVICFYISNVSDKVGRSASLIGLGTLLLTGGWFLERTRRGLISEIRRRQ